MQYPFYDNTVQVRFYWEGKYRYGIAYHQYIVDGLYGEVVTTESVISKAAKEGIKYDDAIVELSWIDLTDTIRND